MKKKTFALCRWSSKAAVFEKFLDAAERLVIPPVATFLLRLTSGQRLL